MRDIIFRGSSLSNTLGKFAAVQAGENRYIMPFKGAADFDIDTFFAYEAPVYREKLLPLLESEPQTLAAYPQGAELCRFLEELTSLPETYLPDNSLIREFIGGSSYKY